MLLGTRKFQFKTGTLSLRPFPLSLRPLDDTPALRGVRLCHIDHRLQLSHSYDRLASGAGLFFQLGGLNGQTSSVSLRSF
jgi:hypothetical protein